MDPPGGVFADMITVTLVEADGWRAVYTLDGSDPRLSATRIVSKEPIGIEKQTTLKVAGLKEGSPFSSKNWTSVRTAHFDIDPLGVPFVRGDATADGTLNISDPVSLLFFLFRGRVDPTCHKAGDWNDDGKLGIADVIHSLNYLFRDGAPAEPPFQECGVDRDEGGALTCHSFSPCQ